MPEIRIETQSDLVKIIKSSNNYEEFKQKQFDKKIKREEQAWNIIKDNRGKYSKEILDLIFDTVDFYKEVLNDCLKNIKNKGSKQGGSNTIPISFGCQKI